MQPLLRSLIQTVRLSKDMSKWYLIFAATVYVALKIIETFFGSSDIYTLLLVLGLTLAVFLGALTKKKANLANSVLLVIPLLIVAGLLSLRYFLQMGVADWMIWSAGLVSGVVCLGFFQRSMERRY